MNQKTKNDKSTSRKQDKNKSNTYKELFNKYIQSEFDSSIGVNVTKKDQFVNVSLAVFRGKPFTTKTGKAMFVYLKPQTVKELIAVLQAASDVQFNEFAKQQASKNDTKEDLEIDN
ncbi:MAG: hypothetical protein ACFFDT_04910 [Candidatus Hodarchaeota archaeon]